MMGDDNPRGELSNRHLDSEKGQKVYITNIHFHIINSPVFININIVSQEIKTIHDHPGVQAPMQHHTIPSWFPVAGFIFAGLTFISLLAFASGILPGAQKSVFYNVWVAFSAAASAAFLGGSASATGQLPIPSSWGQNPITFATAGGVGTFVVVLIVMSLINA